MPLRNSIFVIIAVMTFSFVTVAQSPQFKRTTTKTDTFDLGAGGTVAVVGAPNGSIKIIGGNTNEVEVTAEIELTAASEADLSLLANVTGFVTEESTSRVGVISFGTHNKLGDKRSWKKFPKHLMGLPFKIDYVIRVPKYSDLEIDGGNGDLSISGVEGSMRINFLETNAKIELLGGMTTAVFGKGTADIGIGTQGWRGRGVSVQMAAGDVTVGMPLNLSAEIDALILNSGSIENTFPDLKLRDRKKPFTERAMLAKAGVGGISMKFTVVAGTLKMEQLRMPF